MTFLTKKRKITFLIAFGLLACIFLLWLLRRLNYLHFVNDIFQIFLVKELTFDVHIFNWLGYNFQLKGNNVLLDSYNTVAFDIQYLLKKWTMFLFVLVLVTPTQVSKKIFVSLLILPFYAVVIAFKLFLIIYLCNLGFIQEDARSFGLAISVLIYLSFIVLWLRRNPEVFNKLVLYTKLSLDYIKKKYKILIAFLFLLVVIEILLGLFEFRPWITFLFTASHKILNLFHFDSIVDSFYLLGERGNIYMAKGCLGMRTMMLFAMLIYLTGESIKRKLIFISIGILIINIANILRFVFLFMFIQTHNISELRYDVHDVFNFVVYTIVFVLLIVWFEWFTDIWPYIKKKNKSLDI
jgi:exosortase/archaeosortase family protein